ncbi:MAG: DciA family protein [Candidatus Binatia bacterium]
MDTFRQVLPKMLAPAVRQAPLTPEKVSFAWRTAVGPAIARVTSATLGVDGVLTVTSHDAQWAREVHRLRHDLLRGLEPWLGVGVVTRIEVPHAQTRHPRRTSRATSAPGT